MTTRYFKATDGKIIVFRASPSRAYASASIAQTDDERRKLNGAFSFHQDGRGRYPAQEIGKIEYTQLQAIKRERSGGDWGAPSNSWVNVKDTWNRMAIPED